MSQQNQPKCPYCDFRAVEREEQKRHSRNEHHAKMLEIANRYNQTIEWAIGEGAFLFD